MKANKKMCPPQNKNTKKVTFDTFIKFETKLK